MHDPLTGPYEGQWRPAPAWIAAGLVLGPVCGAAVGAILFVVSDVLEGGGGLDPEAGMVGGVVGAVFGVGIGIAVGFVMTFAGGSHLPGQQARKRAFLVNFCSTGFFVFAVLGLLYDFHPVALVTSVLPTAFLSALAGGALSYRLASVI